LYAYVIGFLLSVAFTIFAYLLITNHMVSGVAAVVILIALAIAQFATQVICFLHLGSERASRDRLIVLLAAILIVLILVSGSVWIMFSLNARMMPSTAQMEQYMSDQGGF
jgi:cytochrome o ubiquinol oxidase subunit IV